MNSSPLGFVFGREVKAVLRVKESIRVFYTEFAVPLLLKPFCSVE